MHGVLKLDSFTTHSQNPQPMENQNKQRKPHQHSETEQGRLSKPRSAGWQLS